MGSDRIELTSVPAFHQEARDVLDTIDSPQFGLSDQRFEILSNAARLALTASAAGLGECRREQPYASLYPLIDETGKFEWRCTHEPPHSAS